MLMWLSLFKRHKRFILNFNNASIILLGTLSGCSNLPIHDVHTIFINLMLIGHLVIVSC